MRKVDLIYPAVYHIHCRITDKRYIGGSKKYFRRLSNHIAMLRGNRHSNAELQKDFNAFGEDAFYFGILELARIDTLLQIEQKWIDLFKGSLYNVGEYAEARKGVLHKQETKEKVSKTKTGNTKPNSGSFKKGQTPWNKKNV